MRAADPIGPIVVERFPRERTQSGGKKEAIIRLIPARTNPIVTAGTIASRLRGSNAFPCPGIHDFCRLAGAGAVIEARSASEWITQASDNPLAGASSL
jgi:hypothetical protein